VALRLLARVGSAVWHSLDLYRRLIVGLSTAATFSTVALIIARFEGIGGWKLQEVAFLYGIIETAFGLMDLVFGGFDPQGFGQRVRVGGFDQMLLRPVSVILQVLGSEFQLRRLGRVAQGIVVLVIALALTGARWTWAKALYLPVVLVSLICFFGGLFILGATVTFWTVQSIEVINILTYGGAEMMSYPMHIYEDWMRRFFTYVVPAIFVSYYPALYFLDKPDPFHMPAIAPFLSPLAGVGTLLLALGFWRYGLRHYTSTGT